MSARDSRPVYCSPFEHKNYHVGVLILSDSAKGANICCHSTRGGLKGAVVPPQHGKGRTHSYRALRVAYAGMVVPPFGGAGSGTTYLDTRAQNQSYYTVET